MSNDFFSFVNKIGSLMKINSNSDDDDNIQNTNNKSKNKRNVPSFNDGEKVYNIKMSEDTKEETLNIKASDMDEEEEEEGEYEEDEKDVHKKEGIQKNNLNKENNKNSDNNTISSNNENKNINTTSSNKILPQFDYEEYFSSHLLLKKGNDFYINDFEIIPVILLEKQKSFLYKIKMVSKTIKEPKDYLLFLDEYFLYFAKDELVEEEFEGYRDEYKRRINKVVSLYDLCDISFEKRNGGRYMIKLEIKNSKGVLKTIEFSVIEHFFNIFMKKINIKLSLYGIDFFSNKNNI